MHFVCGYIIIFHNTGSEKHLSDMVVTKALVAKIDRPMGVVCFQTAKDSNEIMNSWATNLEKLLELVEKSCHQIHKENMVHKAALRAWNFASEVERFIVIGCCFLAFQKQFLVEFFSWQGRRSLYITSVIITVDGPALPCFLHHLVLIWQILGVAHSSSRLRFTVNTLIIVVTVMCSNNSHFSTSIMPFQGPDS